jgi:HSP20 family protein
MVAGALNDERGEKAFAESVRLLDRSSDADYLPLLDVTETGGFVYVTLETPGVPAEKMSVWVRGSCIKVAGEKTADFPAGEVSFLRLERGFGRFCRTFEVIGPVDLGNVSARQKDGVLTIIIPKMPERRGKERLVPVIQD